MEKDPEEVEKEAPAKRTLQEQMTEELEKN